MLQDIYIWTPVYQRHEYVHESFLLQGPFTVTISTKLPYNSENIYSRKIDNLQLHFKLYKICMQHFPTIDPDDSFHMAQFHAMKD